MTLKMTRAEKTDDRFQELYEKSIKTGADPRHALEFARKEHPVRKDGKKC
jgi:hypothetical protein